MRRRKRKPHDRPGDEEHLLSARFGTLELRAGQGADQPRRVGAAKNPRLGMKQYLLDAMPEAGIPLLAKIIDLGQFGHGDRLRNRC